MGVKNTVYKECCEEILDFEEYLKNDLIKVIPLKRWTKMPQGRNYYNTQYTQEKISKHNGNLGVCVGYNHENKGQSLAVIDIDGYKQKTDDPTYDEWVKITTSEDIYNVLKHLPNCLIVRTQSGGKHIYCWNKTITNNIHEISKALTFPQDYHIEELRGKSLKQSIEIFTKYSSKQCVLPGSSIKNKDTNEIKHYEVISTINTLSDVTVVENIHETVKELMTKNGFGYDPTNTVIDEDFKTTTDTELKTLNNDELDHLCGYLVPYFKRVDGIRNDSFLYLGGYLCNKVTEESCSELCDLINTGLNNPKAEHHKDSCLSNYHRDGFKKGLPSLIGNFKSVMPEIIIDDLDSLVWRLEMICNPNFKHRILQRKYSNTKIKYLEIDYSNHLISTYTENITVDKDTGEETVYYTDMYPIYNISPCKFFEAYDILEENNVPKVCFRFYRRGMPYSQLVKVDDMTKIEGQLKKIPGVILKPRESQGVLNELFREYQRLGLINTTVEVPVEGIFINPRTNKLVRSGKDGEIRITKPDKEALLEGLLVLALLYENYNGDKTKLSHILRYGLKVPFSFIWKTKYQWFPSLFLFGVSQTAKTTLAEISLCFYTTVDDTISVGGSSVDTPYRMGTALSRQGLGVIINEPGASIESNTQLFDLIKRAIETKYCREKSENGVHVKIPAYSNMIFTSNNFMPTQDAFVRRMQFIEFTKSERFSGEDKDLFKSRFHHKNWSDTDFLKLRAIGDYVVWYVSENLHLLELDTTTFLNIILDSLFEYLDLEPLEWLYKDTTLMDLSDADENVLQKFRSMVMDDYNRIVRPLLKESIGEAEYMSPGNTSESLDKPSSSYEEQFKKYFVGVVNQNQIPYLFVHNSKDGLRIGVRSPIKESLNDYCGLQISCKGLADYFDEEYKGIKYRGKTVMSFSVPYDKFREVLK